MTYNDKGERVCDFCKTSTEVFSEPSIINCFRMNWLCKKCSRKQSNRVKRWLKKDKA